MKKNLFGLSLVFLLAIMLAGSLVVAEEGSSDKDDSDGTIVTKTKINTDYDKDGTKVVTKRITEMKDGVVVREMIKEKRKFIDADGKEREVKLEIKERMENGMKKRLFKSSENGLEAESELEISQNESADGSVKVKVKTKDGKEKEIKEITHKNTPRVVYHLEGNSSGKFLGIFKSHMNVKTDIDAETGEVVVVNRPWWAFMVKTDAETEVSA